MCNNRFGCILLLSLRLTCFVLTTYEDRWRDTGAVPLDLSQLRRSGRDRICAKGANFDEESSQEGAPGVPSFFACKHFACLTCRGDGDGCSLHSDLNELFGTKYNLVLCSCQSQLISVQCRIGIKVWLREVEMDEATQK